MKTLLLSTLLLFFGCIAFAGVRVDRHPANNHRYHHAHHYRHHAPHHFAKHHAHPHHPAHHRHHPHRKYS